MIFYGLLYQNTAKPYTMRFQGISVFYESRKNAPKRERRKEQKRKSLLRTLTANRLMAEAVRFELTCP